MSIIVKSGSIEEETADALVVSRRSNLFALRGADFAVIKVAGRVFHNQLHAAEASSGLVEGSVVVARSAGRLPGVKFANVLFVIDDLHLSLSDFIFAALRAASEAQFQKITIPLEIAEMEIELRPAEKIEDRALENLARGVKRFQDAFPQTTVEEIIFMAFRNETAINYLRRALLRQDCTV